MSTKTVKKSDTITHENGMVSTKIPLLELIPLPALEALALRFERGVRLKGVGAWNALTPDQSTADDVTFVVSRLAHGILHSYRAIEALSQGKGLQELADGGDAGAIMFAGALLACHVKRNE